MFLQKQYVVGDTDQFDAKNYPEIVKELAGVKEARARLPVYHRDEIIISFFRDHCIRKVWTNENPQVVNIVVGGNLAAQYMEMLFASCCTKKPFLRGYEQFITQALL